MKVVIAILTSIVLTFAITWGALSGKEIVVVQQQVSEQKDRTDAQLAELRSKLKAAEAAADRVEVVREQIIVPGASHGSPEDILNFLSRLPMENRNESRGDSDEHRVLIRQVIREFEELTAMGPKALPAIARFLDQGLDMELHENTNQITTGNWQRGQIYLDPIFPPSLRIGLINSVRHIGKRNGDHLQECERILLNVLNNTGRMLEVAYLARVLNDLTPEMHEKAFLTGAKELLDQPIPPDATVREMAYLDRPFRHLMFDLLRRHKDTTYIAKAEAQLFREGTNREGEAHIYLDRAPLYYISGVLGKDSMPILRKTHDDPRISERDQGSIREIAARYLGQHEDANILVNSRFATSFQLLASTGEKAKENRQRGIRTIEFYLRRLGEGREVAPEIVAQRQQFLATLRPQTTDKEVIAMMDKLDTHLNDMRDPEKAKKMNGRYDARVKR